VVIVPQPDDDAEFIAQIEKTIAGVLSECSPSSVELVKIDNWFGGRWLGFSGKTLGMLGLRKEPLTVPPFVPSRVIWHKRFDAPEFVEREPGRPIHISIESQQALLRKMTDVAPKTTVIWFSGNTKTTQRGSVLVYSWASRSYWDWYAEWAKDDVWRVSNTLNTKKSEVEQLIKSTALQSDSR
jgi:hypothetical protein